MFTTKPGRKFVHIFHLRQTHVEKTDLRQHRGTTMSGLLSLLVHFFDLLPLPDGQKLICDSSVSRFAQLAAAASLKKWKKIWNHTREHPLFSPLLDGKT